MEEGKTLRIEWSAHKARINKRKHNGVSFELAKRAFEDEFRARIYQGDEHGEERWWTIGMVGRQLLVVVHTEIEDEEEQVIRIISARKATASERRRYEEG